MTSVYVISYVASFCMVKQLVQYIKIDFKKQYIVSCYNCSMQVLEDIFYLMIVKRKQQTTNSQMIAQMALTHFVAHAHHLLPAANHRRLHHCQQMNTAFQMEVTGHLTREQNLQTFHSKLDATCRHPLLLQTSTKRSDSHIYRNKRCCDVFN